jgi:hypothetical protein
MKIHRYAAGFLAVTLTAMLSVTSAWAAHRSDAEQAIAEAKAAHDKATGAGADVTESANLIKQAEDMIPTRQYSKAIDLANMAKSQDDFALSKSSGGDAPAAASGSNATAEKAIADAEAARKKAASVGGEWRDTGKMIKQAADLAKAGEFDKAIKLANLAKDQGELGYAQAMHEKNAGFPSYVHIKQ